MEPLLLWAMSIGAVGVPVVAALLARQKLLAGRRAILRDGLVAVAGALGLLVAVLLVHARVVDRMTRRFDGVYDGLCAGPAAGDDNARAFHNLACSSDVLIADLRGASEYQGVWVHLATQGDKLAVYAPRPDAVPPVPQGKGYRLWLLDAAGNVVDHAKLDRAMSTLIIGRPYVAEAVKAVVTLEPPASVKPSGPIIVQGTLAPL